MSVQPETIEISGLPPGTKDALEEIGRSKGKSAEEYLRSVIEAEILASQSFDEQPLTSTSQQPVAEERGWPPGFFEATAGAWQGEPLVRGEQGEYEVREELE